MAEARRGPRGPAVAALLAVAWWGRGAAGLCYGVRRSLADAGFTGGGVRAFQYAAALASSGTCDPAALKCGLPRPAPGLPALHD